MMVVSEIKAYQGYYWGGSVVLAEGCSLQCDDQCSDDGSMMEAVNLSGLIDCIIYIYICMWTPPYKGES
jgi:hypothetical protein